MKSFKTILISILGLFIPIVASAAIFNSAQVGSSPVNGYYLKTDGNTSTWAPMIGGGLGTWSTTTSSVLGRLINYPNNATDIAVIGGTATTTGKYWLDPNTQTSYHAGNNGFSSSSPSYPVSVIGNEYHRSSYVHFGNADSGFSCNTISTSCIELIGDDNTMGGVILQIENRNTGASAFSGLNLLNNEASRGNNASFYAGLFLNGSNYSDPTFGVLNNVPRIMQLGNTMGAITVQSSSTDLTVPYINFALNNLEIARITPFGLGVGTTSARFPVQIAATTTSQLVLTSDGITESNWGFRNAGGYQYISPINPVTFATSTNPSITMSPTLNQVAIGTSTLAAGVQLTIGAGANPVVTLFDSTSATGMYTIYRNSNIDFGYIGSAGVLFTGSAGSKTDLAIRASQNLTFGSGSGEDMRISTTGLVGIATSSPYKPLSVVGAGGVVAENYLATSTTATSTLSGVTLLGFPTENAITSTFANAQVLIRNNSARTNALNIVNDTGATSILSLSNAGLLTINGAFSLNGNITCNTNCAMGNNTTTAGSNSTIRGSGAVDGSVILLSTSGVGTSDSIIFRTGDNGNRRSLFVDTNGNITVGTSSPLTNETAQFTIVATSTATRLNLFEARTPNLGVATTSVFTITGTGVQLASSTPPTLSTCGTSPSITGNNNYGAVTTGGSASACTVTFANGGFPTFASCVITNQSMSVVNAMTYTVSATAFTVSQTGLGGSIINYRCDGF